MSARRVESFEIGTVVRIQSDADRGAHLDLHLADDAGLGDLVDDLHGHPGRHFGVLSRAGHDHELVAAEPGHEVVGSQNRRDALRNRHQERVTDAMTVQIVDELEVVEVDEHDGEGEMVVRRMLDQALEAEVVRSPVGQAGQGVGESQAMDLRFGFVPSLHLAPEIGNPPPAIGETEEPEEEQRGDERIVEVPGIALDMVGNVLEELAIRGDSERRQRDEPGSRRFPKGTVGSQKRAYAAGKRE